MIGKCLYFDCEYNDPMYEDNCSAPEEVCNRCEIAEWSDEINELDN